MLFVFIQNMFKVFADWCFQFAEKYNFFEMYKDLNL